MPSIIREESRVGSLLSNTSRVEAPFVRVSIGGYTFGVYEGKSSSIRGDNGVYTQISEKYPNYIQSMSVKKINGTVNQYTLNIEYPITENDDPNFFEKIFSSSGYGKKISIHYGDFSMPDYIYRDEEAIVTKVTNRFNIQKSSISYTIEATSASMLTLSGSYTFPAATGKPSDMIYSVLYNGDYHLTEVFTGMRDRSLVEQMGWIAGDDKTISVPTCIGMSPLEYISFLVSYMNPVGSTTTSGKVNIYSLTTFEDTQNKYGGSYFTVQKIQRASTSLNQLCTYEVDIGYPTANIVTEFNIENNENWSMIYNYNRTLENTDYLRRIDNKGNVEYVFSPQLSNTKWSANEDDITWWSKVTGYPVNATLKLKGLLRPVVLMQYIKLNVWFFGHKHISSGYYIITSQTDDIGFNGYFTTLKLTRIAADTEMI